MGWTFYLDIAHHLLSQLPETHFRKLPLEIMAHIVHSLNIQNFNSARKKYLENKLKKLLLRNFRDHVHFFNKTNEITYFFDEREINFRKRNPNYSFWTSRHLLFFS